MKRTAPEEPCVAGMARADVMSEDVLSAQIVGGSRAQCMLACATLASMGCRTVRTATLRAVVKRTFGTDLFLAAEGASVLRAWAASDDAHGTVGRVFFEQDVHVALSNLVIAPACHAIVAWRHNPCLEAIRSVFQIVDNLADAEAALSAVHSLLESSFVALLTIAEDTPMADSQIYDAATLAADAMLCSSPKVAGCSALYMRLLVSLCENAVISAPPALLAFLAGRCTTALRSESDVCELHTNTLAAYVRACALSTSCNAAYLADASAAFAQIVSTLSASTPVDAERLALVADFARDVFGLLADAIACDGDGIADTFFLADCLSSSRAFVEKTLCALGGTPDATDSACGSSACATEALCRALACIGNAVLRIEPTSLQAHWTWAIAAAEASLGNGRLSACETAEIVCGAMRIVNSVFRALLAHGDESLLASIVDEASGIRLASVIASVYSACMHLSASAHSGTFPNDAAAEVLPALGRTRSVSVLTHEGTIAAFTHLLSSNGTLDHVLCVAEALDEAGGALGASQELRRMLASHAPKALAGLRRFHEPDSESRLTYIRSTLSSCLRLD